MVMLVILLMWTTLFVSSPQVKNVKAFQQCPWGNVHTKCEVAEDVAAASEGEAMPILVVKAMGSNYSGREADMRPVERVYWRGIRGNSDAYTGPNSAAVDLD